MANLLYTMVGIMIIVWLLGYFVFSAGTTIHVLPVIAVILVIGLLIRGGRVKKRNNY